MVGGLAQRGGVPMERTIQTPVLNIGFEETGSPSGFPIILLHGFPDDVRAWDGRGAAARDGGTSRAGAVPARVRARRDFAMPPRPAWRSRRRSART